MVGGTAARYRAVCYNYTGQWQHMAADARESSKLEPDVPEHYLRCAVALKQLGSGCQTEFRQVCAQAQTLEMPETLRAQFVTLMDT